VWVVSDGASDMTAQVARQRGAHVLELETNAGKANAMLEGMKQSAAPYLLYMDADLVGLTDGHVRALVEPILDNTAQSTLGLFSKGRLGTDLAHKVAPTLSGQRVVPRWLMEELMEHYNMAELRYGVETAITHLLHWHHIHTEKVSLEHMTQRTKEEKNGKRRGISMRLRMYKQVAIAFMMTVPIRHMIQMWRMR